MSDHRLLLFPANHLNPGIAKPLPTGRESYTHSNTGIAGRLAIASRSDISGASSTGAGRPIHSGAIFPGSLMLVASPAKKA
jgi:hypothetical protein